jgi:hypothetical protein
MAGLQEFVGGHGQMAWLQDAAEEYVGGHAEDADFQWECKHCDQLKDFAETSMHCVPCLRLAVSKGVPHAECAHARAYICDCGQEPDGQAKAMALQALGKYDNLLDGAMARVVGMAQLKKRLVLTVNQCNLNTAVMLLKVRGFRAAFGSKGYTDKRCGTFWDYGGPNCTTLQHFINPLTQLMDCHVWGVEKNPEKKEDPFIADCVFPWDKKKATVYHKRKFGFADHQMGKCLVLPQSVWKQCGIDYIEAGAQVCSVGLELFYNPIVEALQERLARSQISLDAIEVVQIKVDEAKVNAILKEE